MNTINLFSARKQEITSIIDSIKEQIKGLQQELLNQENYLQQLGTVEQAGQSALDQTSTFLSMVRAIDPTQEEVFWHAVNALKGDSIFLPASVEVAEQTTVTDESTILITPPPTIEVPVQTESKPQDLVTYENLSTLNITILQKIADNCDIKLTAKERDDRDKLIAALGKKLIDTLPVATLDLMVSNYEETISQRVAEAHAHNGNGRIDGSMAFSENNKTIVVNEVFFSEAELKAMNLNDLRKLAKTHKIPSTRKSTEYLVNSLLGVAKYEVTQTTERTIV
jgi:hypothetical protein